MALTQISTDGIKNGTITNADINSSAAIAGTKISPNFGSQNVTTTGFLNGKSITLTDDDPNIVFTDNDANPDFKVVANGGIFRVQDSTNGANRVRVLADGTVDVLGNLDVGAGLDVTGNITATGSLTITNNAPNIILTESDADPDFDIKVSGGEFKIKADGSGKIIIRNDGHIDLIDHVDISSGLDVTGNITATGDINLLDNGTIFGGDDAANTLILRSASGNVNHSRIDIGVNEASDNGGLHFYTAGSTVATRRMTIKGTSGNVGIGTTLPSEKLDVSGNIKATGTIETTGSELKITGAEPRLTFTDTDNNPDFQIWANAQKFQIYDNTDNKTRILINSSGHITLGTDYSNNPSNVITGKTTVRGHCVNTGTTDNDFAQLYLRNSSSSGDSSASIRGYREDSNYNTGLRFYTHNHPSQGGDGDERMRIDSTGRVGINTTEPVEKLGVNGDIRFVNPTGTTRRISALPSGSYSVGVSGGAAIGFTRFSDAGGGSDQIIFETHHQGSSHGERMRIDKTGRVLIGTTGHDVSKLYVSGGSFSLAGSDGNFGGGGNRVFLDHDNNDVRFGFTGGGGSAATKGLRFYTVNNATGTSNHNRITPIGEFRICHGAGSANSVSSDFVNGIGDTTLNTVQSNLARLVMQERTGNWISFKTGGGTHFGTIARSGSGVLYGSNSDYRLKDNVANLTGGIALVKQLRPVTFNWNELSGLSKTETHQGFIAHEVQALVPDAVDGEKDGMDIWGDCTDSEGNVTQTHVPESKKKDGETWTKKGEDIHDQQLDTVKLIPILTAAIKSLISKVEVLETEVAELKAA